MCLSSHPRHTVMSHASEQGEVSEGSMLAEPQPGQTPSQRTGLRTRRTFPQPGLPPPRAGPRSPEVWAADVGYH